MTEIQDTEEKGASCPLHGCFLCKYAGSPFFKRVLARLTDYLLWGIFSIVFMNVFFMYVPVPRIPVNVLVWSFLYIMFALYVVVEAALIARFGKTIGKALAGVRVTGENGERLSFKKSLRRAACVFVRGMGAFIPLLSLIVPLYRLISFRKTQTFVWDEKNQTQAEIRPNGVLSKFILIVFYAVVLYGTYSVYSLQNAISDIPNPREYLTAYMEEVQPLLTSSGDSPLAPENVDKTLEGLKAAQAVTTKWQDAFLALEEKFQERTGAMKDKTAKEMLTSVFHDSKEQIMGFLFMQQMRISLFENIAEFFKRAEGRYTLENGKPVFKTPALTAEYERHMEQLSSFFQSVTVDEVLENRDDGETVEETSVTVTETVTP